MMRVIEPLVNHGPYIERHDRWYLMPAEEPPGVPIFFPVHTALAHERFVRRWARDLRNDDARARRDAREQFLTRLEAI